ncbi:MAG: helix-turn-helix domain-containing protein [Leptospirillum sp.]
MWLTINEVAARLGLSPWTIRSWITQKRLGYVRLGRSIRISESEVERLIRLGTRPADVPTEAVR